jgi:hypothetical protein
MTVSRSRLSLLLFVACAVASGSGVVNAQLSGLASAESPAGPLATLGPFEEWVASVAISPDGSHFATGTYDGFRFRNSGQQSPFTR